MNSYSTHNDFTAVEFCCCRRKNKKKRRKQRVRRKRQGSSQTPGLGIAERALNDPRNLTSTNGDTSKRTRKITTQNKEAINDKRRHKNVTNQPRDTWQTSSQREHKNKTGAGRMTNHADTTKRAREIELPREP
jgi:hypothetical protein